MADLWQAGEILAGYFSGVAWSEAPSAPVLTGGAFVSSDQNGNFLQDPGGGFLPDGPPVRQPPFARIERVPFGVEPELVGRHDEIRFRVFVTCGSGGITATPTTGPLGDSHGAQADQALLRDPVQPQGKSAGRVVDEVIGRLLESLSPDAGSGVDDSSGALLVDSVHGLQGYVVGSADRKKPTDGSEVVTGYFDVVVTNGTVSRTYHAPPRFKASNATSGNASLTWNQLPQVYSLIGIKILRKAGSTPPSGPNDGTATVVQALLSKTATSLTDAAGAGTWSYAAFGAHDETHTPTGTTPDRFSPGATATVAVT